MRTSSNAYTLTHLHIHTHAHARSFYPLYPPAAGVPLDASLSAGLDMTVTPDLLVLPSDLAAFAKVVRLPSPAAAAAAGCAAVGTASGGDDAVVVINPGRAAKGGSAGTFAWVRIAPSAEGAAVLAGEPAPTNAGVPHRVAERCQVQIIRL